MDGVKMYRIEIVSNQSVQEDVIELLEQEIPEIEYTVIPTVYGRGIKSKKLGTSTWPEQNFVLFSYVELDAARKAKAIIQALCKKFPGEGITFFCVEDFPL